jgi:hypothetical protein
VRVAGVIIYVIYVPVAVFVHGNLGSPCFTGIIR